MKKITLNCGCQKGICSCDPMRVHPPVCCKDCPMTKDNWIKALESLRTSPTGAISMCLSDDGKTKEMIGANKIEDLRLHLVKYFKKEFDISNKRAEKNAIEKTNKRWRERIALELATVFMPDGSYPKAWNEPNYAVAGVLSDLLEDKK